MARLETDPRTRRSTFRGARKLRKGDRARTGLCRGLRYSRHGAQGTETVRRGAASYDRAIALKPEYPEAFSNRGIVLRELQCWDKAVASLETALAVQPDLADAHNNLGTVLQDLGQLQQALECYQQAIRLNPNLATVYINLADLNKFTKRITIRRKSLAGGSVPAEMPT